MSSRRDRNRLTVGDVVKARWAVRHMLDTWAGHRHTPTENDADILTQSALRAIGRVRASMHDSELTMIANVVQREIDRGYRKDQDASS